MRLILAALASVLVAIPGHAATCPGKPNALGVARTVEIDTTGGPGFGMEHYRAYDFLQPKEVILTFDDGPQVRTTHAILKALADHCTKATFFSIGKMALGLPEILRDVAKEGHTIGLHTWSHKNLSKMNAEQALDEIERGASAVQRALGQPVATFFRYPFLRDSKDTLAHFGKRGIGVFSTDIDSFDFKVQTPERLVKAVMAKLDKRGKGIVLMHDIQPTTAKAMPALLDALAKGGYRIVHMRSKDALKTLPDFDKLIEKDVRGLPAAGAERPLSSVVKTVKD
ncbi:MAG: polysaccharide deacetylase family protein [Hyphomicrobiaceae bacterium]